MAGHGAERVEILPVAETHIERLHACFGSVARERLYLARVEAPTIQEVESFIHSALDMRAPYFVAVIGTEVVGWCNIMPNQREGFRHRASLGIGVLRPYRGQGIGRKLMDRALGEVRKRGLEKVELEVFASNKLAIKLYEKTGFVVEGVKRRARKIDGKYDDIVEMALFLTKESEVGSAHR